MASEIIASNQVKVRKLLPEEIAEIEHEMTLYPDKRAVGLEALKIVQKHQGWVSDESLMAIAKYLDLPASDLEGVATFFNLVHRKPVGKHVILFCNSVSCWIMGCENIRTAVKEKLSIDFGETSENNEFTFIPVPCLGDCDNAPVMMVGPDLHRRLTPEKVSSIIDEYSSTNEQQDN